MKAVQCVLSLHQVPQNHMAKSLLSYDNKENRFKLWRDNLWHSGIHPPPLYASVTGLVTFSKTDHERKNFSKKEKVSGDRSLYTIKAKVKLLT